MGEATVEELKQAAEESLKALARALGAKTYIFVVAGNNQVVRSSSHDLKPYERALVDEIEKASANRIVVWEKENPLNLRRAEDGLSAKHAELHPIVAVMIEGLNKLNNHKVSRSTALKDSSSTPAWWPHSSKKYAERTQQLNIKDLTLVIDAIFAQIRHNPVRIEKLRSMLGPHFKTSSCSISTRAVFDAYFDFLLEEAYRTGNGALMGGNGGGTGDPGEYESLGFLKILPRPSVSEGQGQTTAQLLFGFQADGRVPPGNIHRPQPIHQEVPEFTKQGLRFKSVEGAAKGVDAAPHVGGKRGADTVDLSGGVEELLGTEAASIARPDFGTQVPKYIYTVHEYVEPQSRKRARVNGDSADPAWPAGGWTGIYSAPLAVPIIPGLSAAPTYTTKIGPTNTGAPVETSWAEVWPPADQNGAVVAMPRASEWPSAAKTEAGDSSVELLKEQYATRVTDALRQLAEADNAKGCMWTLVGGSSGKDGRRSWSSPNLKWHTEAFLEEMENVVKSPILVTPVNGLLPKASDVLGGLVRSPRPSENALTSESSSKLWSDLVFLVGTLVRAMNRITCSEGSPGSNTVPDWFPYPTKYRENMQSLDTAELLNVLDVVFLKIRGEYFHIRELKGQWHTSRADFCSLRLRAAVDAYLDALETEARVALLPDGGKPRETSSSGTPILNLGGILKA